MRCIFPYAIHKYVHTCTDNHITFMNSYVTSNTYDDLQKKQATHWDKTATTIASELHISYMYMGTPTFVDYTQLANYLWSMCLQKKWIIDIAQFIGCILRSHPYSTTHGSKKTTNLYLFYGHWLVIYTHVLKTTPTSLVKPLCESVELVDSRFDA